MNDLFYFLRLHGKRLPWLMAGLGLMLASALAGISLLALSGWFVTATGLSGLLMAAGVAITLDIYRPGAGIRAFAVGRAVTRYGERLINHEAVLRTLADLRLWVLDSLLLQPSAKLAMLRDGELLNRITTDVSALDQLFLRLLAPTLVAILALLAAFAFIAFWTPLPALLVAGLLLSTTLLCILLLVRYGAPPGRDLAHGQSRLRQQLIGLLDNLTELRLFDPTHRQTNQILDLGADTARRRLQLGQQTTIADCLLLTASQLAVWLMMLLGLGLYGAGIINGPVLVMLVLAVFSLGEILRPLPLAWQQIGRLIWNAQRLRSLQADPIPQVETTAATARSDAAVKLDGVWFRHRTGQPWCLQDVSLRVEPGEHIGIMGPSGSGKSTLFQLLQGDLAPCRGRLHSPLVPRSGTTGRHDPPGIAVLGQRTVLFQGSIAENLQLAAPEADSEALWQVLEEVELAELIDSMPRGLDSYLGPGGRGLSGGQARRLAMARTLLVPAGLLLLDEPAEGLDQQQGMRILERLAANRREQTIIAIAHDRDRLPPTDRILVLRDGSLTDT